MSVFILIVGSLTSMPGIYVHLKNRNYEGATFWMLHTIFFVLLAILVRVGD